MDGRFDRRKLGRRVENEQRKLGENPKRQRNYSACNYKKKIY